MRRPRGEPHVAGAALVVCPFRVGPLPSPRPSTAPISVCPFRVGPLYCLMLFQIGWRALVLA